MNTKKVRMVVLAAFLVAFVTTFADIAVGVSDKEEESQHFEIDTLKKVLIGVKGLMKKNDIPSINSFSVIYRKYDQEVGRIEIQKNPNDISPVNIDFFSGLVKEAVSLNDYAVILRMASIRFKNMADVLTCDEYTKALKDLKSREVLHFDVVVGGIKQLSVAKVIFEEVVPTIIDGEDMRRFLKDMTEILVGKVPEFKNDSDRLLHILEDIRDHRQLMQQGVDHDQQLEIQQRIESQERRVYDLLLMFALRLNMGIPFEKDDDSVKSTKVNDQIDSKEVHRRSYRTKRRVDTLGDRYRRPGPKD